MKLPDKSVCETRGTWFAWALTDSVALVAVFVLGSVLVVFRLNPGRCRKRSGEFRLAQSVWVPFGCLRDKQYVFCSNF